MLMQFYEDATLSKVATITTNKQSENIKGVFNRTSVPLLPPIFVDIPDLEL